jgi:hypothetical protein
MPTEPYSRTTAPLYEDWWDAYETQGDVTPSEPIQFVPVRQVVTAPSCACGNPTCTQGSKSVTTPHGRYTRYTNHNCRCEPCVEAYRVFRQRYRVEQVTQCGCGNRFCQRKTRREVKHGLSCYYRHKCRCKICVTAVRDYQRAYRAQRRAESTTPQTLMEVFAEMDSLIQVFIG